jgi:hypothetical protein
MHPAWTNAPGSRILLCAQQNLFSITKDPAFPIPPATIARQKPKICQGVLAAPRMPNGDKSGA